MQRAKLLAEFDSHGVLSTSQRIEIADILFEKPQHLSAEQILDRLRVKGSRVSKATVYNTLKLFCDRGLVRECVVDAERRFYDTNIEPHHHFYNLDTRELTDIPHERIRVSGIPEIPGDRLVDGVEVLIKLRETSSENLA
jgi:Fur family iron response transcriptional regulator